MNWFPEDPEPKLNIIVSSAYTKFLYCPYVVLDGDIPGTSVLYAIEPDPKILPYAIENTLCAVDPVSALLYTSR